MTHFDLILTWSIANLRMGQISQYTYLFIFFLFSLVLHTLMYYDCFRFVCASLCLNNCKMKRSKQRTLFEKKTCLMFTGRNWTYYSKTFICLQESTWLAALSQVLNARDRSAWCVASTHNRPVSLGWITSSFLWWHIPQDQLTWTASLGSVGNCYVWPETLPARLSAHRPYFAL